MVTQGKIIDRISDTNWFIYILKLLDERYYNGIAVDLKKRFSEHLEQGKNSSSWCKQHKAIKIIETIDTNLKRMKDATLLEDIYLG